MIENGPSESQRLDVLRRRQASAWERGERLVVEVLIADVGPPLTNDELLELIYTEVMLRAERGEVCAADEYVRRFPQFAESLQRLFAIHEALEAPASEQSESIEPAPGHRPQPRSGSRSSDRNLLFGIVAMQMDFISREALIEALRDWTTQKDQPLGQILVKRGNLSASRRELLELLVDEHVRRHDDDPAASLASISSVIEGTIEWHRVHDAGIAESLAVRRLTRNLTKADEKSGATGDRSMPSSTRFRVLRPHAKGGIGEVFLAFDEELHREVALKEIQSRHLWNESQRERFVREAEVTGGLEHPGIVPVYSLGHHGDGRPFYAMRFIRGDSLKEAIEQFHAGPKSAASESRPAQADLNAATLIGAAPPPPTATPPTPGRGERLVSREEFASVEFRKLLGRFIDVCQAIEYAHSRGVLHRDLKPGNIMLGKYGETLVVDWGLAKAAGKDDRFADSEEATFVPSSGSGVEQTQQGSVVGTPSYMSPEQAAGKLDQLGPTTDVYSLGATLYHLLTGQAPFTAQPRRAEAANAPAPPRQSMTELLRRVQHGEFPRPREIISHVPTPLEAICLKAMSLSPADRYASSSELAEDIEHWLADEPVTAHRETLLATASRWVRKHRAWAMSGAAALALVAVVSSVAAVWINSARSKVVTAQKAEAIQLGIALRNEKDAIAAQRKAEAAALAEKLAKEEEVQQRLLAIKAAEGERKQRLLAEQETTRANSEADRARRSLFASQMNLLQHNWEANQVGLVLDLLENTRPQPGETDIRGFEWHYWDRLCHSWHLDLRGHSSHVQSVVFSPDGKQLASAGGEWGKRGEVKVWDAVNGQEMFTLKGLTDIVYSVAFSPDGKLLATAGAGGFNVNVPGELKIWNAVNGQEMMIFKGHSSAVSSVAFSPDGKHLVSAGAYVDRTVKIWDATSGQETLTLEGHTEGVLSAVFSPDGKHVATGSVDQTVKVWDAVSGQEMLMLKGHARMVRSVAFSPDGKRLASASDDGTVKVWDTTSGQETLTLKGGRCAAFSPDGKRLASASSDKTVKVWDATSGQETLTLKGHTEGILCLAFSPDGKRLASASSDQTVKVWDATRDQETLTLNVGKFMSIRQLAFSADGKRLASVTGGKGYNQPGEVKVWDITSGQATLTFKEHVGEVYSIAFSPDGKRLASGHDKTVKVWDATSGRVGLTLKGPRAFNRVVFSPDGERLAAASSENVLEMVVTVWNTMSGEETLSLKGNVGGINNLVFSPDGKRLASAGFGTVKVWDSTNGQEILTLKGGPHVAFSPDGKQAASAGADHSVKLWNAASGHETLTLKGHINSVSCVSFSPDGKRLASSGDSVKVWDATSGQVMLTLKGSGCVAFSPDGKRLAAMISEMTGETMVKVWDARPWTPELRAEREALSLIHFLRDQGQPPSAWLAAIAADQTISEPVRHRALQFAREWK